MSQSLFTLYCREVVPEHVETWDKARAEAKEHLCRALDLVERSGASKAEAEACLDAAERAIELGRIAADAEARARFAFDAAWEAWATAENRRRLGGAT